MGIGEGLITDNKFALLKRLEFIFSLAVILSIASLSFFVFHPLNFEESSSAIDTFTSFYETQNNPIEIVSPLQVILLDTKVTEEIAINGEQQIFTTWVPINVPFEERIFNGISDLTNENNLPILLFGAIIAGLLFVVYRTKESFESFNFKKITSLSIAVILLSWGVSVPASIGASYWGIEYAEANTVFGSIQFDNSDKGSFVFVGDASINDKDNPSLVLDGKKSFVSVANSASDDLSSLTVSAWVKPDYSNGPAEFTVLSKDKSFMLTINKLISPEKVAKFSVFDGLKWYTVESTSTIEEKWTHLAATFADSTISIYVDGQLDGIVSNIGMPRVDSITSDSDIIIGAYSKNGDKTFNEFAGQIDNIQLNFLASTPSEIKALYDQNRESSLIVSQSGQGTTDALSAMAGLIQDFPNPLGFLGGVQLAYADTGLTEEDSFIDSSNFATMQLPFIENQGQINDEVRYYSSTFAGTAFVNEGGLTYSLIKTSEDGSILGLAINEKFLTIQNLEISGIDQSPTIVNYFVGEQENWRTNIPTFESISLGEVFPSVNVELKAYGNNFEKIFRVAPGGSIDNIRIGFEGIERLAVSNNGDLIVETELGTFSMTQPIAYQLIDGERKNVDVSYHIDGTTYGFVIKGDYDPRYTLVIDPLLASTLIGGSSGDGIVDIAFDSAGNVLVTGTTSSSNFPTTGGAYNTTYSGGTNDSFVANFTSDLSSRSSATYIGGTGAIGVLDEVNAIGIDSADNVFIAGETSSTDFPTTGLAFNQTYNGGTRDGFVSKFTNNLSTLEASTYFGGDDFDQINDMVVSASGDVYITGQTFGGNLNATLTAFDTTFGGGPQDAFVSKLNNGLTQIVQLGFLGGNSADIGLGLALEGTNVLAVGQTGSTDFPTTAGVVNATRNGNADGYITRLNSGLTSITTSTYWGGDHIENNRAVAVDGSGDIFVGGDTTSASGAASFVNNFPTTAGAFDTSYNSGQDPFVSKFNSGLTTVLGSTFVGGTTAVEFFRGLSLNGSSVLITGITPSSDFPTTTGAIDETHNGGFDVFVTALNSGLTALDGSTFIGGDLGDAGQGMAVDSSGNVFIVGNTDSFGGTVLYPTTSGAFDETANGSSDGFITKLSNLGSPVVNSPPVANDDNVRTNLNATGDNVAENINVLANDNDADGDTLTITAVGTPLSGIGTATINATSDGINYEAGSFIGTDQIIYTVSDGTDTDTATVFVRIPTIAIDFVNNTTPKYDIDPIEVTGFTTKFNETTDTVTIDWGDGNTDPGIAIDGDGIWSATHTYDENAVGTNEITANMVNNPTLATTTTNVIVQKHNTTLILNAIADNIWGSAITIEGVLTDSDTLAGLGGTIALSGNGTTLSSDTSIAGAFSEGDTSPVGPADTNWIVNANFTETGTHTASGDSVSYDTLKRDVELTLLTPVNLPWGTSHTFTGALSDETSNPVVGATILFNGTGVGTVPSATTLGSGAYSSTGNAPGAPPAVGLTVYANYTGDGSYNANVSATVMYDTLKRDSTVTLDGIANLPWGTSHTFTGTLTDNESLLGIAGQTILFNGTGVGTVPQNTTIANGDYSSTGNAPGAPPAVGLAVIANYTGNVNYNGDVSPTVNYDTLRRATSLDVPTLNATEVKWDHTFNVTDNTLNDDDDPNQPSPIADKTLAYSGTAVTGTPTGTTAASLVADVSIIASGFGNVGDDKTVIADFVTDENYTGSTSAAALIDITKHVTSSVLTGVSTPVKWDHDATATYTATDLDRKPSVDTGSLNDLTVRFNGTALSAEFDRLIKGSGISAANTSNNLVATGAGNVGTQQLNATLLNNANYESSKTSAPVEIAKHQPFIDFTFIEDVDLTDSDPQSVPWDHLFGVAVNFTDADRIGSTGDLRTKTIQFTGEALSTALQPFSNTTVANGADPFDLRTETSLTLQAVEAGGVGTNKNITATFFEDADYLLAIKNNTDTTITRHFTNLNLGQILPLANGSGLNAAGLLTDLNKTGPGTTDFIDDEPIVFIGNGSAGLSGDITERVLIDDSASDVAANIVSCTNCNPSPSNVLHLGINSTIDLPDEGSTISFKVQDIGNKFFQLGFTLEDGSERRQWYQGLTFTPITTVSGVQIGGDLPAVNFALGPTIDFVTITNVTETDGGPTNVTGTVGITGFKVTKPSSTPAILFEIEDFEAQAVGTVDTPLTLIEGSYVDSGTAPIVAGSNFNLTAQYLGDANFRPSPDAVQFFDTYLSTGGVGSASLTAVEDSGTGFTAYVCGSDTDGDGWCNNEDFFTQTFPYFVNFQSLQYDVPRAGEGTAGDIGVTVKPFGLHTVKDVFVEIDYMPDHLPNVDALNDVIAAFANSPVDGGSGINLHVVVDEQLPEHRKQLNVWRDSDGDIHNDFGSIKARHFGFPTERTEVIVNDNSGTINPVCITGDVAGNTLTRVFIRNVTVNTPADSVSGGFTKGTIKGTVEVDFGQPVTASLRQFQSQQFEVPAGFEVFAATITGSVSPGTTLSQKHNVTYNIPFVATGDINAGNTGFVTMNVLTNELNANAVNTCTTVASPTVTTTLIEAKAQLFHYAIWGHNVGDTCGASGVSESPGNDLVVTTGCNWGPLDSGHIEAETAPNNSTQGTRTQQAGTFMHEFGHNFGLNHGGPIVNSTNGFLLPGSAQNCKPNHISVMSYSRQVDSFLGEIGAPGTSYLLDYSRGIFTGQNLFENSLSEPLGLETNTNADPRPLIVFGTPNTATKTRTANSHNPSDTNIRINWDADSLDNEFGSAVNNNDINNLSFGGCEASPGEILRDYNEWDHLVYDFRNADGGSFDGPLSFEPITFIISNDAAGLNDQYAGVQSFENDGTPAFKDGSAVVIEIIVKDPEGNLIRDTSNGGTTIRLAVQKVSESTVGAAEAMEPDSKRSDKETDLFDWQEVDGFWKYVLDTKSLQGKGTYELFFIMDSAETQEEVLIDNPPLQGVEGGSVSSIIIILGKGKDK